jgi:phosphate transport system ATP-binding protein
MQAFQATSRARQASVFTGPLRHSRAVCPSRRYPFSSAATEACDARTLPKRWFANLWTSLCAESAGYEPFATIHPDVTCISPAPSIQGSDDATTDHWSKYQMQDTTEATATAKEASPPKKRTVPGPAAEPLIRVRNLNVWYGKTQALIDVKYDLFPNEVLAFIGPSGCGKTTAIKCLNRMLDAIPGIRIEGTVTINGKDIYDKDIDPPEFRSQFGLVPQKPNPFAATIHENVAYGARIHGLERDGPEMDAHVEDCLRRAFLWDEVKDGLNTLEGVDLSGGQQQRLCIARAFGTRPMVLLMDEPTGSIDPIATKKVEQLILELRKTHAVVVVTHSMMEARRIADRVAMFYLGRVVEIGPTEQMFEHPVDPQTKNFMQGLVG